MNIRKIGRYLAVVAGLSGVTLTGFNTYGLTRSLRAPLVSAEPRDFAHNRIISPDEAWSQLEALDPANRPEFALRANEIIGSAIKHLPYAYSSVHPDTVAGFYLTVPIWENYFLYFFRFLKPRTYRAFQFNGFRPAIERGIGQCGQQSVAVAGFLEAHGFRTGIVTLDRHVVATAEIAPDQWYVLDPDFGVSIPHSVEEVAASEEIVAQYYDAFDNPGTEAYRDPWSRYSLQTPEVSLGSRSRYPRGSVVEALAYRLKWPFPILLILIGGLPMILRWKRAERGSEPCDDLDNLPIDRAARMDSGQ